MKRKLVALFMLVNLISATVLSAEVSAKTTITPHSPMDMSTTASSPQLSATNANLLTPGRQAGAALVTFENFTPWTVEIFTDGQFRGLVLPMHSRSVWTGSGYTVLSARASFAYASPVIWNSGLLFYYPGNSYSWRLAA